jgi:hypothetical protein
VKCREFFLASLLAAYVSPSFARNCDDSLAVATPSEISSRAAFAQSVKETADKLETLGVSVKLSSQKVVITPLENGSPMNKLAWALQNSEFPTSLEFSPHEIKKSYPTGEVGGYFSPSNHSIVTNAAYLIKAASNFGGEGASILIHEVEHWAKQLSLARGKDQLLNNEIVGDSSLNSVYRNGFSLDELKTYSGEFFRLSKIAENLYRKGQDDEFQIPVHRLGLIQDFCARLARQIAQENAERVSGERWSLKAQKEIRVGQVLDKRTHCFYEDSNETLDYLGKLFGRPVRIQVAQSRKKVDLLEAEKLRLLEAMNTEFEAWLSEAAEFIQNASNSSVTAKLKLFQKPRQIVLKYEAEWDRYLSNSSF